MAEHYGSSPDSQPLVRVGTILRRGLVLQGIAVLVVASLAFLAAIVFSTASDRENEHEAVITSLLEFRDGMSNARAALRDYALLGRESDRLVWEQSVAQANQAARRSLRRIESDRREALSRALSIFSRWRGHFAPAVLEMVDRGDLRRARRLFESGEGPANVEAAHGVARRVQVEETQDGAQAARTANAALASIAGLVGLVALLVLIAGAITMRRIRREVVEPIDDLADAVQRLGQGDFSARVTHTGSVQEVSMLSDTFNQMAEDVTSLIEGLRSLDELKSGFVSSVSHELRTPLTSIKGYLEALVEGEAGELNDEQSEYAEIAVRNTGRLQDLVADLLMLSRLDSGRLRFDQHVIDVSLFLAEVADELRPVAHAAGVALLSEAPGGLTILGDKLRLQQAISSLVDNAIKYSKPPSTVEITAKPDNDFIAISVRDHGVGIPAHEIPKLKERFYRGSTVGAVEGTGLGLAIATDIVDRHGGRIDVRSEVGVGSEFRIYLPRSGVPQRLHPTREASGAPR